MKVAVFLLGAGGSGKTTSRIAFCKGGPRETRLETSLFDKEGRPRKMYYTQYDNCSLAGNATTGTDANIGPAIIRDSFVECTKLNDIIMIDGVMSSKMWVEMINEYPEDMEVLLVHFNLSKDEVVKRLMNRRRNNGKIEDALPEKTLNNSLAFLQRAVSTMKHFEKSCTKQCHKIEIVDSDNTQDIVNKIQEGIENVLRVRQLPVSKH